MSIQFYRAPTVAVGDKITSTQMAGLAAAINSRAVAPVGDAHQRLKWWWRNAFRQLRMPDASGFQFPPQDEYWFLYQHLTPEYSTAQYPVTGPDEPEGMNTACIVNQFVSGGDWIGGEDSRISSVPLWEDADGPQTLAEFWSLGKAQRGAVIPVTAEGSTPALSAAREAFFVGAPFWSPHGKGFGGFFPTPEILANNCGGTEATGVYVPSYEITFTALATTSTIPSHNGTESTNGDGMTVITYAGSCPDWTDDTDVGHVWTILRTPFANYVLVNTGGGSAEWDVFPTDEWIEGPYDGNGRLTRYDGGHISRMMWSFISDFRGTPAQRTPDTFKIRDIAFDFQAFSTRQYYLSPARGTPSGGGVEAVYPTASFTGTTSIASGTFLDWQTGATHTRTEGFVFAGFFIIATKLFAPCSVDIIDEGGATIQTLTLTPDGNGYASQIVWLQTASEAENIRCRVTGGATFTATNGTLSIEVAELADYKPQFYDAYLVLRLSATTGGTEDQTSVDGGGITCSTAKEAFDNYATYGCIYNPGAAGIRTIANAVNTNPNYDSFRRLSREMMKIVRRQEFVSYEVADGKSIFRFKRWAYGMFNEKADIWYGMAPSFEPESELIEGEEYVVRATGGAYATYRGAIYTHGQRFIATSDTTFQTTDGAYVHIYDGIRTAARKKGWSNEWAFSMSTHSYHPSESSIWKKDAYADYFPDNDRCLFYPQSIGNELHRHVDVNYAVTVEPRSDGTGWDLVNTGIRLGQLVLSPESVSGYRYFTVNTGAGNNDDFCKSCRVFEPPLEVESCIVEPDMVNGGQDDIVKITLTGRVHYDPDFAPATVDPDVSTWDSGELDALRDDELYRTDDNAIREYARHLYDGTHGSWKVGDAAEDSLVQSLPDNPFGSIMPHFFFTKLVPKPYDDGNDSKQDHDTRMTVDALRMAEIWIKAMCEGFIDGFSTEEALCADNVYPYEYIFENLCNDAFGGRWIGAFGLSARDDHPAGHGPLPNTIAYADVFNRLSSAVNLLTDVAVRLPFQLQSRTTTYEGETGVGSGCVENTEQTVQYSGSPPPATSETVGSWVAGLANPTATAFISQTDGQYCTAGGAYRMLHNRTNVEFRFSYDPAEASFQYALHPDVLELLESSNIKAYSTASQFTATPYRYTVTPPDGEECIPPSATPFEGYRWDYHEVTEDMGCIDLGVSEIMGGHAPGGDFYMGAQADGASPPVSACGNQSERTVTLTEAGGTGVPIVSVPIVDP